MEPDRDSNKFGDQYYIVLTYGCQMNENDSERFAGQLKRLGYHSTTELEKADLIVINTCCVRESAEKKIHGKIGELKRYKALNPNIIIVIAGCMAQKEREKLLKKFSHLDIVIGTHNIHQLAELVQTVEAKREKVLAVWDQAERLAPDVPTVRKGQISAWVPIMYGCNNFCTYCIVPYVRGRERSRPLADIISEIEQLGKEGFKEITLLGQNVNSYGKDSEEGADFADLLKESDSIQSIARIRYMTSHPRDMNDKVIKVIQDSRKICEHFHLPIQAGSDKILDRMNRGYTTEYYCQLVKKIRDLIPGSSITTDIIVGFPGETDEMFQETLEFVKLIGFDAAYTFLYSQRSGTPAAQYEDQIPLAVKKARLKQLMDMQNQVSLTINKQLIHRTVEVLVEGFSKTDESKLMGRTRTNKIVIWEKGGPEKIGQLVNINVTSAQTWLLKGRLTFNDREEEN
ncbi:MAG TPA: tRNA (N6-isopentenyl adenosine(37)-C2)-methylthiotransferase MiaB [Methylomusa anaerophila]|uniref:tRNA (N6-isopentenyl adenosine(37)-C2)-methylthiotransferase MiaB n=1 Tax=Methylomusa anaerophila TaxID=1930071 RepID=UPI0022B2A0A4|nr:tRNA (N6-isopentenyl adenosine(37)-C2)-methylthiotransferase MiaB [Methylomusa anaerophila]HML87068.1 tRNA (N6-isopentenyl adenosine(37)-C2)-methylthiotransferase MiaB [Methylomusa anaerophila]